MAGLLQQSNGHEDSQPGKQVEVRMQIDSLCIGVQCHSLAIPCITFTSATMGQLCSLEPYTVA